MQLRKRMELSMQHFTGSILQVSYLYFSKRERISIMSKANTGSNSNGYTEIMLTGVNGHTH
jgi:hypothetical protein